MVLYFLPYLLTSDHTALNYYFKALPFVVTKQWCDFAGTSILNSIWANLFDRVKVGFSTCQRGVPTRLLPLLTLLLTHW